MKETHILMGSISSGTLHPKHLIPCFLGELERINPKDYDRIMEDPYIKASGFVWEAEDGSDNDWWDSDETHSLLNELFNALDEASPENYYFGAHPDDGALYGFWEFQDED